jgi:hypothetical protein
MNEDDILQFQKDIRRIQEMMLNYFPDKAGNLTFIFKYVCLWLFVIKYA